MNARSKWTEYHVINPKGPAIVNRYTLFVLFSICRKVVSNDGAAEDAGIDGVVRLSEHNNRSCAGHKMLALMALPSLMRPWILCCPTARKASPLAGRIARQLMSTRALEHEQGGPLATAPLAIRRSGRRG
jgi:hypothetical protein